MNLQTKLERSRSTVDIDFSKYPSANRSEPLEKLVTKNNLTVEPNWTLPNDWEGRWYVDYIATHPNYDGLYVRSEVARRLYAAAESLDKDLGLVIRSGHRPLEVQQQILSDVVDDYKRMHPDVSSQAALEHARTFVSDPSIKLPPHVCGAAVDVGLLRTTNGRLLDFGSPINDNSEKSFLHYPNLSQEQKTNRMTLLEAMLNAGFASLKSEWWHYSYGDQVWAWFYGQADSLYSPVDI